ncbi:MAG: alpha/beta fold hydrolase, partial [Oligoflexia bacterium]|nr:alpha/beta fold hydrolase [Oligoflexia bacterium]
MEPTRPDQGHGRVAICLHGFLRTGVSMLPVRRFLVRQGWAEVKTPTMLYQAKPLSVLAADIARAMRQLSQRHDGQAVDLVTHSMGGLLARGVLAEQAPVGRIVMLAPPNQGAWMAERVRRILPVHYLGWDPLGPLLPGAPASLPTHAQGIDIGILTGGSGTNRGMIPFLPGDNDGRVCVEEARLDDAAELRVVPFGHTTIMARHAVLVQVSAFLQTGRFPPADAPAP